jgi:hypothetical protein
LSYADEYNRITMTGHPDVISAPTEGEAPDIRLIDWKFGRLEGDHDEQVNAYAFLALQHYPHAERVYVAICRVREQSIDSRYITREEAAAWYVRFLERLKDTTYRPGRHCGHCSRGADCEAKGWLLQQSLAMVKSSDALPDDPEERAVALENLLAAARLVAKATDDAQELVRAEVIAAGGQLGNLRITSQTQRKLSFPAALPILQAELGDDLAPILRASKTDCEKIIGDKAPYRGNGKAIKAFNERLDAAGALRIETIEKLTIINVRKQLGVTA